MWNVGKFPLFAEILKECYTSKIVGNWLKIADFPDIWAPNVLNLADLGLKCAKNVYFLSNLDVFWWCVGFQNVGKYDEMPLNSAEKWRFCDKYVTFLSEIALKSW